jgi:lipoprotein-anchoring transpeptidase ErfK/SrfK
MWGAPTTLSVLAVKGAWVEGLSGSQQSEGPAWLENVPVWVPRDEVVLSWTRYRIDISLRAHRLRLVHAGRAVGSWLVGVGAPSSPTPTGRSELVEKIAGADLGAAYGCCILGLSAKENRGAMAGGQVAIHGTDRTASIGANLSNGCVHGTDAMLRDLSRRVPLGAPVFIKR